MSERNHQGSGTIPLKRDPNSIRSKKRAKRGFSLSRPNRRAEKRLNSKLEGYQQGVKKSTIGGVEYTKPGALKKW